MSESPNNAVCDANMSGSSVCSLAGVIRFAPVSLLHVRRFVLICSSLLVSVQFYHNCGGSSCLSLFFLTSSFRFPVLSSNLALILDILTAQSHVLLRDPSEFYFFAFYVGCDMNYLFIFIYCFILLYNTLHLKRAQSGSRNLLWYLFSECFFIHI